MSNIINQLGEPESVRLADIPVDSYSVLAEHETLKDLDACKEALSVLNEVYPGHFWAVKVTDGIMHIKNMSYSHQWGIARKMGAMEYDAGVFKREVIRAGGEYLERARLSRSAWNGDTIEKLDGMTDAQASRVRAQNSRL